MANAATERKTPRQDLLLDIRNLKIEAKVYPPGEAPKTITLVHDVSLSLKPGKVLGLIGESGAGKSTIGLSAMAYGRGGVCVGGCYLTGDVELSDAVLRHESVHKQQWLRYGFLMPVLYLFAGRNALRNRFEIEAGLEDGGYVPRSGR